MSKNFQIRGDLMVEIPKPFRRQQLSLHKHYKDKQIRRELELLERKRQLDIRLEAQWQAQKKALQEYTQNQQQQDAVLKQHQRKLRQEMFRLETRKQQIESRTNPQIIKEKGKKLMQYLRCVPYTAGSRLERLVFWGGEDKYFKMKFLIEYGLDRFLGKSFVQRSISSNLQRTVFCSKAQLGGQSIMVTVKQVFECQNFTGFASESSHNRSSLFAAIPFKQASYELAIYSITGRYFCIRKIYTYKEIFCWSSLLENKDKIPKTNKPRLSVAENLAKQNALKQLADKKLSEISSQESSPTLQLKTMEAIKKQSSDTLYNTSLPIAYEHEHQHSCVNLAKTEIWQENLSEQSEVSDSSNNSSRNPSEQCAQTEQGDYEEQSYLVTRKTCQSKSSFCPNSNSFKRSQNKLIKPFLGGRQATLFPKSNPLQNIVVLKEKKEIYILSQYLNIVQKKQLVQRAVSRFRLKIQLKKQLKKCLFYRVMQIDQFDETKFFLTEKIKIPFLFTIKQSQLKDGYELKLNCCSIKHHAFVPKAVDISVVFHKEREKAEPKEVRIQRVSNIKMSPKASQVRRSRDTKRKSSARIAKKQFHQLHQKSSFHSTKKGPDRFKPFSASILEKFQSFLQTHTISLSSQRFLSSAETATKLKSIILIQKNYKRFLQRRRYKDRPKYHRNKMRYFRDSKIFFGSYSTCEDELIVYIESLQFGRSSQCLKLAYSRQYLSLIDGIIGTAKDEGNLWAMQAKVKKEIEQAIQKRLQRQKPEKSKEKIRNLLNMFLWRLKARENIYLVKKMKVKERMFFLLIRRDSRVRSILQCSLYGFEIPKSENQLEKKENDQASKVQTYKVQQLDPQPVALGDISSVAHKLQMKHKKYYTYQRIYLHQNYFDGIEKKAIIDEFLIDHKIFLLKPAKTSSVHYIERLNFLDINSDQITKEFINLQKEQMYAKGISTLYSNSSIKGIKNQSYTSKIYNQSSTADPLGSGLKLRNIKKNSIEESSCLGLDILIKQSLVKEIVQPMASKASLTDSSSLKNRQGYILKGNSHQSLVYYSLYKSIDIFFYLDLYTVKLGPAGKSYTQSLTKVHSQRLYKKQLQDMGIALIYKKIAEWLKQNQDDYLILRQFKDQRQAGDKTEECPSNIDVEEGMNIFNQCLQLIESNTSKRFSHGLQRNGLSAGEKEKGSRNNTLTL